MSVKWQKRGLIYAPTGDFPWARSYAFNPTPELLNEETIRIYFASLDEDRFGRIGSIDVAAEDPATIKSINNQPVFELGDLGTFDDSGVNPSFVLKVADRTLLYYIGWQRCERVPYMLFAGLAVKDGNAAFERYSRVPILDRTASEPFSRASLYVLKEESLYKGWYWSCENWSVESNGWIHYNNVIRYAESTDGIHWRTVGRPCIFPEGEDDYTVGRPWVIKDASIYKMWYSIRSRARISYRIGYAQSEDGVSWRRMDDDVGIAPSTSGWDSEMICCPAILDVGDRRYMFYNGNRHGSTGFGYAVLED